MSSTSSKKTAPSTPRDEGPQRSTSAEGERLVSIGRVVGCHGIRGELRVRLFNAESSALARIPEIFLLSRGNRPRPARVRGARPHQGLWLLTLEDVSARDDAELLRGFEVSIRETDLDPTAPGEFYHYQLIGLEVVDESGVRLGSVREVMATGASDVLILDGAGEPMIPMVDEAIRSIDLGARRIVVRPPRGLLEP